MSMRMDVESAKQEIRKYSYALLYMFGKVILTEVSALSELDWSDCLEARFFGDSGELRFWRESGDYVSAKYSGQGESITTEYALDGRYKDRWKSVSVTQYLDYDEDGQVYVCGTALSGLGR